MMFDSGCEFICSCFVYKYAYNDSIHLDNFTLHIETHKEKITSKSQN